MIFHFCQPIEIVEKTPFYLFYENKAILVKQNRCYKNYFTSNI